MSPPSLPGGLITLSEEPLAGTGWVKRTVAFTEGEATDRLLMPLELAPHHANKDSTNWSQFILESKQRRGEGREEEDKVRREMRE